MGLVALALVVAACAPHASQDTLKPQGPYAREIKSLFIPVLWVAAAVFLIVEGGIVWIIVKYRHRKGRDRMPAQTHGNTRLEIGWTIAPALVLAVVMVPTVATIWDLASKPPSNAINVTVTGRQWWWKFEYTDPDMKTAAGGQIVTANEMVIPTGRTVYLTVTADSDPGAHTTDGLPGFAVIHSFWVPELAGKQDAIPTRENHILMQADHPGIYHGQCAEFCGLSHGIMRVQVRAVTPQEFDAWVANQKLDALTPQPGTLAATGMQDFTGGQCIVCHAIAGIPNATADAGPNLTHFASRGCFAGCLLDNQNADDIRRWLEDPAAVKPGAKMPNYHLSPEQIDALVAYLMSLK
ncbi:MAG: cytochrome c oxidase subunit II [Actinobacteria bacterium]|nr:cytochrome c oxidase subunit II [Actinomycetota bacterium]